MRAFIAVGVILVGLRWLFRLARPGTYVRLRVTRSRTSAVLTAVAIGVIVLFAVVWT